jgi:hypothetical protein
MPTLTDFFQRPLDLRAFSAWLDGLDADTRIATVRSLSGRQQAALFEAAQGFKAITLDDFVPPAAGVQQPVIHYGRNSLPGFSLFEKRFLRPAPGADALWGYNEGAVRPLVGPGYFLARTLAGGEVRVDYAEIPPEAPAGWPPLKPNSAGLSRFVFHNLSDTLRGVSTHVSIGRAARKGKPMDSWFVLVRA